MDAEDIITSQYATRAACPACGRKQAFTGRELRGGEMHTCTNGACLRRFRPADLPGMQEHIRKKDSWRERILSRRQRPGRQP